MAGMSTTPKRRWFQVSIREAALVLLALGFVLAWYAERQALVAEQKKWEPVRQCAHSLSLPTLNVSPWLGRYAECNIDGIPVIIVSPNRPDWPPAPKYLVMPPGGSMP
jgi:hypothetical protein